MKTWRPKHPEARFAVAFHYARKLDAIDSAQVSIELAAGVDATPAALLDGAPQIDGATVYQRLAAGVHGANYRITCIATRGADRQVLQALLPVRTTT